MTQSSSRIQGKFTHYAHEKWLRACKELVPADKNVLYYLKIAE